MHIEGKKSKSRLEIILEEVIKKNFDIFVLYKKYNLKPSRMKKKVAIVDLNKFEIKALLLLLL